MGSWRVDMDHREIIGEEMGQPFHGTTRGRSAKGRNERDGGATVRSSNGDNRDQWPERGGEPRMLPRNRRIAFRVFVFRAFVMRITKSRNSKTRNQHRLGALAITAAKPPRPAGDAIVPYQ